EDAPARFVLLESGAAQTVARQHAHNPSMCLFVPWFEFEPPGKESTCLFELTAPLIVCGQRVQGDERLCMQRLLASDAPCLELLGVRQRQAREKAACIEFDSRFQA